jgi:hypothetical protein
MRRRPRAYKDLTPQRQSDDVGSGSQTKVWLAAALHHLFNWTMAAAAAKGSTIVYTTLQHWCSPLNLQILFILNKTTDRKQKRNKRKMK